MKYLLLFSLLLFSLQVNGQDGIWEESQFQEELASIKKDVKLEGYKTAIGRLKAVLDKGIENYPNIYLEYLLAIQEYSLELGARDSVYYYLQKCKLLIREYELKSIWKYHANQAVFYYEIDRTDKAIENSRLALQEVRSYGTPEDLQVILQDHGRILIRLGEFAEAEKAMKEAVSITQRLKDKNKEMAARVSLGDVFFEQKKYEAAALLYNQSYDYSKRNSDKKIILESSSRMGNLYLILGQYDVSLKYLKEALEVAQDLEQSGNTEQIYFNKARSEIYLKKWDAAKKTLTHFNEDKSVFKPASTLCGALLLNAKIAWAKKDYPDAHTKYKVIDVDCRPHEVPGLKPQSYLGLARFRKKEGKNEDALDTIAKALTMETLDLKTSIELLELKTKILEEDKDYKAALSTTKEKNILSDSLIRLNNIAAIILNQSKRSLAKSELEVQQLESINQKAESKNRRRRNIILGLIASIFALGLASYFYSRNKKLELEKELAEVKQNLLRIQINPHFIFNVLNSIQSSFLLGDQEKTLHLFNKFSSLMRQVLENSVEAFIPLNEEIEMLINYLELEKVRTNNKFDYEIDIGAGIDIYMEKVPSMILQIFIENSIWHGIIPKKEKGLIKLNVEKNEGVLKIAVIDDGVGRAFSLKHKSPDQQTKKSMGTSLVKQRVHLLNRKFGKQLQLRILDGENNIGTRVELGI